MNINWKYVTPVSKEQIAEVEKTFNIIVPDELKAVIMVGNNGVPSKRFFDTDFSKEHELKTLLSYDKRDIENIFSAFAVIRKENENLIPIANDPAGNLICLDNGNVVFWKHETNEMETIASSITDFFDKLY